MLFWNIDGRHIGDRVAALALRELADVVILAECDDPSAAGTLRHLNPLQAEPVYEQLPTESRLVLFSKHPRRNCRIATEGPHFTARRIARPLAPELLVIGLHLGSQLHFKPSDTGDSLGRLAEALRTAEKKVGHRRSIVIGDFNADPFHDKMVSAAGLHAISSRAVARLGSRVWDDHEWPLLYNPMWRYFGDHADHPPGTYYYRKAVPTCQFWHVFDQVLIRSDLLPHFDDRELRIVTEIDGQSLLTDNGVPDRKNWSDHLPILLRLTI